MLVAPPWELRNLVHHEGDCVFTLDESATPEQRELFDEWIEIIEEMKRDEWGDVPEEDE